MLSDPLSDAEFYELFAFGVVLVGLVSLVIPTIVLLRMLARRRANNNSN
jgi:hypothetical protein